MYENRKPLTESDLLRWLQQLGVSFPPVTITVVEENSRGTQQGGEQAKVDAQIEIQWREQRHRFAVEIKALSTPKTLDAAILQIRRASEWLGLHPLLVTTYLSEDNLRWLEREGISGLDRCGNGVIVVPGELLIWRSGAVNTYPRGTAIQNVYRGTSSLVARTFLLKPCFDSAQELLAEVQRHRGKVTLATVSKVCSALAEDLLVERQKVERNTRLALLQSDGLLDALAANFQPPAIRRRFVGKCSLLARSLTETLLAWQEAQGTRIAKTGTDSTERYATMAREPIARFYCTDLANLLNTLGSHVVETTRFPNIEFLETTDPGAYFDVRDDLIASPIQCFLELQTGDKRDQDTAEQVRRLILRNANDRGETR